MAEHEHILLDEILEKHPSPEAAYLVLSTVKKDIRPEQIIQYCRRALHHSPDHIGLRTLLAEAYTLSGLLARASEELSRAAALIGEMAGPYLMLARAHAEKGSRDEALRLLHFYLTFHPDDEDARELLTRLQPPEPAALQRGETREEKEEEEEKEQEPFEIPEIATATLAELYLKQGEREAAIRTYRKVVERNPDDEQSRNRLNELEAAPLEQESLLQQISEADPERLRKEKLIGVLEAWLSRIQEARSPAAN